MLRIYQLWLRLRDRVFTTLVRGGFARIGRRSVIQVPVRLAGTGRISIGDGVFIGDGSWLQVMKRAPEDGSPVVTIGDGCSITGHLTVSAAVGVVIEDRVLIARHVYIADHGHEFGDPQRPVLEQGITNIAPVRVGRGAWLGQGVVICSGVTIGRNAVVGANSVVRSDVPDFCVAAGAPARVIRRVDGKPIE